jgi:RimJ/RimL family protein N-acetyltransferase
MSQPVALHERAAALVGDDLANPPHVAGDSLAGRLPDGVAPGTGWPQPNDLVGLAASPRTLLIVVDGAVAGGTGPIGVPDEHGVQEIGYGIAPAYQGRGVATTAVGMLCARLFADPEVRAISAEMLEGNERSWLLVERLGFQRQVAAEREGHRRYLLLRPALRDHPYGRAFGRDVEPSAG